MIQKVRCIDANAKQMAIISNRILKKSPKFAQEALSKNAINSYSPRFTQKSVKEFYNIDAFYDESGAVREDAKPYFAKVLDDIGLNKNATLEEFANFVTGVYK